MSGIKRLLISLTGGILVPFSYLLIAVPVGQLIGSLALSIVLLMPLLWPRFIYLYLFGSIGEDQTPYLLFLITCNVTLYGLITYAVLLSLLREKTHLEPPPPPPQFH